MKFTVEQGPVFSILRVALGNGETVRAEAGAMICMSTTVQLQAKTSGKGLFGALGAMVGGEGLFASEYTGTAEGSEVVFAPGGPGDIVHLPVKGATVFAQSGAYLAGSSSLQISTQGSLKAMVSGEGLFLQKITGDGELFLTSYGAVLVKDLAAGEEYMVDTGNMVAFEGSVTYTLAKAAKGLFSTLASGEGLVCRFRGPGKVWIQTRSLGALAQLLTPFFPSHK